MAASVSTAQPLPNPDPEGLEQRVLEFRRQLHTEGRRAAIQDMVRSLPDSLRETTWKNLSLARPPIPAEVLAPVQEWMDEPEPHRNLTLVGDLGVGKTWVATAAIRHCIAPGQTFRFQPMSELYEVWKRNDFSLALLTHPYWLLLDDLGGTRYLDPKEMDRLFAILNSRQQSRLPTVVTSNQGVDQLRQWMSARSFERLVEGEIIEWAGTSRRRH